eukprot:1645963-Pyramimonas_sp.AAC.1
MTRRAWRPWDRGAVRRGGHGGVRDGANGGARAAAGGEGRPHAAALHPRVHRPLPDALGQAAAGRAESQLGGGGLRPGAGQCAGDVPEEVPPARARLPPRVLPAREREPTPGDRRAHLLYL